MDYFLLLETWKAHIRHADLFFLFWGMFCLVSGIVGMAKRQVIMRGKVGKARIYEGRQAMWLGFMGVLVGALGIAMSILHPL
ncbi:hypothetical protein [Dyella psychrodurans]|uniref:Uncharacterized protein n=1 Tax=Dyella psychrodurans TaxID=1927960 RepID=A0A370X4T3_9GAMM|nr:hypothetical protein [Dyella psychrodurans]RDS83366.1 hypothetical protein DWU99_12565 [Dyella psychrodurans]